VPKPKDIVENLDKIEKSHTYQAGLSGAVNEAGKALTTVGQAVNAALLPVRGLIWGADQIAEWMNNRISEKLENIPPEKIVPPNPHVAGPAIEALRFTAQEEELREMFAELLANSINADKSVDTHPAFVDLIKSMNGIDARVLKELSRRSPTPIIDIAVKKKDSNGHQFLARNVSLLGVYAGLDDPWRSISVIENLERMGLAVVIKHSHLADAKVYSEIQDNPDVKKLIDENTKEEGSSIHIDRGAVEITRFGNMFVNTCVA
jgi:hypothetical protein